ncbi:hypothetical protein GCM10009600_08960 [Oerskovia paurometabola]
MEKLRMQPRHPGTLHSSESLSRTRLARYDISQGPSQTHPTVAEPLTSPSPPTADTWRDVAATAKQREKTAEWTQ